MTIRYAIPLLIATQFLLGAPPLSSEIDSIFTKLVAPDQPGAAVLVRSHGHILFQRGYGVRDLRTRALINEHTDFRLASVTKQFTAMAIMLLVKDGKLRYDRTLTGLFPEFPPYGRTITIRHLLTHTSGLPDYEDLMDQRDKPANSAWTAAHQIHDREVLGLLERQTNGKFTPGSSWSYSNSGYVVLGLIVEAVSGEPFPQFLRDRIFQPLHMSGTVAWVDGRNTLPNRAYGHTNDAGRFVPSDQSSTSATLGDGGVYSSLADLAKWDEALENNVLLTRDEMNAALTPVKLSNGVNPTWPMTPGDDNLAPGTPVQYGFGWFLDPWRNHRRMWHFGSTMGFRTAIERFTADGLTVIVLCNRTDLDAGELALQVADGILPSGH